MPETRERLNYRDRVKVIELYHSNKYKMTMAEFLLVLRREGFANICAQTVNRYVREEANIRQHASNPQHADRSRQLRVAMPKVEALLSGTSEFLSLVNEEMKVLGRKIVLLCDNCSSHKLDGKVYSNVEMLFLPSNLTSWIQPMDAGIICTFKANYKRLFSQYALERDADGVEKPYHIHQLDAMRLADRAWVNVTPETIQNCWRHTGICPEEEPLEEGFARAHL